MLAHVRVPAEEAELAADALWQAGASAVEERANGDGSVTLIADAAPAQPAPAWEVHTVDDVDMAVVDTWRAHAEAVRAGTRIVVQPPWVARPVGLGPSDLVLEIDPGHAFGSGSHPTTRLMLAALERLVTPGSTVLDVGCGSGVLAVAAVRLGAASVVAVDVDDEALAVTRDNARRNGIEQAITTTSAPVGAIDDDVDLVLANIGLATITELAPALASRAPVLLLSGILAGTWDALPAAFPGFAVERVTEEEGWVAIELRARTYHRP